MVQTLATFETTSFHSSSPKYLTPHLFFNFNDYCLSVHRSSPSSSNIPLFVALEELLLLLTIMQYSKCLIAIIIKLADCLSKMMVGNRDGAPPQLSPLYPAPSSPLRNRGGGGEARMQWLQSPPSTLCCCHSTSSCAQPPSLPPLLLGPGGKASPL